MVHVVREPRGRVVAAERLRLGLPGPHDVADGPKPALSQPSASGIPFQNEIGDQGDTPQGRKGTCGWPEKVRFPVFIMEGPPVSPSGVFSETYRKFILESPGSHAVE